MSTPSPGLHPLHRLWQALPAHQRRLWLARGTAWIAPRAERLSPPESSGPACGGIVVGGEIRRASGMGEAARIMDQALQHFGVPHASIDTAIRWPRAAADAWPDRAALVLHVNAPQLPATLIGLGRRLLRGRRIIGNWYWELPVVPASWHPALAHVHEIWVPSRFTAQAFEVLAPGRVRVVPPALALAPPVPSGLDRQAFGLADDVVVVLTSFSLASSFARKNPLAAIAAFRTAFGDRSDRLLLLKVGNSEHHGSDLLLLHEAIAGAANIRLETRMLPDADMHALTRACDIVLSLHRSEGFGLVPAQAMLLRRPVVSTDWSATSEFLDESCGVPIGYRLVAAVDPRGVFEAPGAVWAEADIDHAAQSLRALADSVERRTALGHAAEAAARRRLGGDGLLAALTAIGAPVAPQVAAA